MNPIMEYWMFFWLKWVLLLCLAVGLFAILSMFYELFRTYKPARKRPISHCLTADAGAMVQALVTTKWREAFVWYVVRKAHGHKVKWRKV